MALINFPKFVTENNLQKSDEETVVCALIKQLSLEICPRVLIEDFPQTEFQAKFFNKNCVEPLEVFVMNCSKDICQERMFAMGETHPSYIPSSILAKKVQIYNERAKSLIPFLQKNTHCHIINSEQQFNQTMKQICTCIEPTIVNVRSSGSEQANEVQAQIQDNLCKDQGYKLVDVADLLKQEELRRTALGCRLLAASSTSRKFTLDMYMQLICPIIWSGQACDNKFVLSGFPNT